MNVQITVQSRGVGLGYLYKIRAIEDAEIECIVSGKISAKADLQTMKTSGDELLELFEKSVK